MGALVADGGDLAVREGVTEHAARNRESWAREAAAYAASAERKWAADEITWGILGVPESEVGLLGEGGGEGRGRDRLLHGVRLGLARSPRRARGRRGRHRGAASAGQRMQRRHGLELHLGHGDWIRVLRSHGLGVEALVELRNPGRGAGRHHLFTAEWAERWPAEEMWKARKVLS
jgi:hypothetical protein